MISIIDCTLRDGGHLTKSNFGEKTIKNVIKALAEAKTEIIEIGFLKNQNYVKDTAVFSCVEDAKQILSFDTKNSSVEYALMAQEDQYNVSKLEICDGTVKHIRVSFHNYDIKEGLDFAREVAKKGYKCHVNPINLQGYSDKELIDLIYLVNDIHPHTFTIVDTFGAMTEADLNRIVAIIDNNLLPNISIGLHLHENLGLSFSLAQFFTKVKPPRRDISIDASMNGIGRVPGNLSIELIMSYMNNLFDKKYDLNPIYDAIDNYIIPIKKQTPWGYSLPYALSAQYHLHRTYTEFLISKVKLKTKDIQNILSNIEEKQKAVYNKDYIQKLYLEYLSNEIDDTDSINALNKELKISNKKILLLAPGNSLNIYTHNINEFIQKYSPIIICSNFSSEELGIKPDYLFFSNIQRYEYLDSIQGKLIATSNIIDKIDDADYILNFGSLCQTSNGQFCDNALILLLNLLKTISVKEVMLAGFDGFKEGENFYNKDLVPAYEDMVIKYNDNEYISDILKTSFNDVKIETISPSCYFKNEREHYFA